MHAGRKLRSNTQRPEEIIHETGKTQYLKVKKSSSFLQDGNQKLIQKQDSQLE